MTEKTLSERVAELEALVESQREVIDNLNNALGQYEQQEWDCQKFQTYMRGDRWAILKNKKGGIVDVCQFGSGTSDDRMVEYVQSQLGWGKNVDESVVLVRVESTYNLQPKLVRS